MLKEQNTVILTCMDSNFEDNLINDFLKTLRKVAGYQGKIVILDYGMSIVTVNSIENEDENVEIIKCNKDRHIFSARFRDMAGIIGGLSSEITHVMSIDGGDIWFQAPIDEIFELCKERIGYIEECYLGNNWWNKQILNLLRTEEMEKLSKNFRGTRQKNAGMICGPRDIMSKVSDAIGKYVLNNGRDFFGLDQLYFNYIINNMSENKKIVLPDKYNYVLIDNSQKLIIEDNLIYNEKYELMTVIHNAGGAKGRIISKGNKKGFDESPYRRVIQIYK
ncbi:hypothetical protein [Ruminiclostridium cellobioparum]|uniref:Glycosyltransferase n=1 Tax=Ruminiclostridium cellobioparum subsp. termitidis CT1112 TaxID=1195236 RepID=S0FYW1_RUMCE|nr:hypothetical protein [Ruminiclostridium cellobioparum]EMS73758.1 hypothetical protein CTER_0275 [Ruminiclostridium cellobioparum subsp. termitidis CT1112]